MKLSICVTVYNQIEILRRNIDALLQCERDDVEFVISDNCSADPIEKLVRSYGDDRLKYCRTPTNLGHDLNIIFALRHCAADHALVFRTKDMLLPGGVDTIIQTLDRFPLSAYILFSAIDEHGRPKVVLSDKEYKIGPETAAAHTKLMVHPSGNIYNLRYLDLDMLERYMREHFSHVYGFCVHDLIRMQLCEKGTFITSSRVVWQYANTHESKEIAVNASSDRLPIYAPPYEYDRYRCEFDFVSREIKPPIQMIFYKYLIKRFSRSVCYDFKYFNSDQAMQQHYGFDRLQYSPGDERKRFRAFSYEMFSVLSPGIQIALKRAVRRQLELTVFYLPFKHLVVSVLQKNKKFYAIVQKIKKI